MGLARSGLEAGRAQALAEPGYADAERDKGRRPGQLGREQRLTRMDEIGALTGGIEVDDEAQNRGHEARSPSSQNTGNEDRRHQEEVERLVPQGGCQ